MSAKIDTGILSIKTAAEHLAKKDFSAEDLTRAYLENIKVRDGEIHSYLEVFGDALAQAKEAQKLVKAGSHPLAGIPLAIKDNILIKGRKVSAASKMLENYSASYDATAIKKLKNAGTIFLGRTNMDEFAMGGSTENSAFGPTKNPFDTSRVPGGSSGGSAAAVGANMALAALGSDTGGSIRQPAGFCGVIGLKPTYGAVSRHGLMAMGSSLDQIGPIAKTVTDAEILFNMIAGRDPLDSTSLDFSIYNSTRSDLAKKKLVIGVPRHLVEQKGIDKDVLKNFNESLAQFEKLGYEIREISLPRAEYALAVYYILMPAEVSSNLARFDGVKYGLHIDGENLLNDYKKTRAAGFGKEVRRRILLGTYVLSSGYYDAYYGKAQAVRRLIVEDLKKVFAEVDIIATPTSPTPAWKIGEKIADPLSMYLADIFTVTANIAGIPGLSVPSGSTLVEGKNLPLGFQMMASHGREDLLFKAGKDFLGENI